MRGRMVMGYIATARGSPWVVPSIEYSISPSIYSSTLGLHVLVRIVARGGHRQCMLRRAACWFWLLKALLASASKTPSVSLSWKVKRTA